MPTTEPIEHAVITLARVRRLTLATAESCTGGLVAERLTRVPGASDVFLGAVVAYDNRIKQGLLDVPEPVLREHGAVSEAAARAMALGACARLGADAAAAVTGIAGPGGGTAEKPVGLVYIATARGGAVRVARHAFAGDRGAVRAQAAGAALAQLLETLEA